MTPAALIAHAHAFGDLTVSMGFRGIKCANTARPAATPAHLFHVPIDTDQATGYPNGKKKQRKSY
jgi:hypothetical protein